MKRLSEKAASFREIVWRISFVSVIINYGVLYG
jgi:hypothetical protein